MFPNNNHQKNCLLLLLLISITLLFASSCVGDKLMTEREAVLYSAPGVKILTQTNPLEHNLYMQSNVRKNSHLAVPKTNLFGSNLILQNGFGQNFMRLNLTPDNEPFACKTDSNNQFIITDQNRIHTIYPVINGTEWEIQLLKHPDKNTFSFPFTSQNLIFAFQDSLSTTEQSNQIRPDSVINSYAIYTSKSKLFHIYRPKAWDNAGDTVWCILKIDTTTNLFTLTIPDSFLNHAAYPVTIDPTIGNTTLGASELVLSDYSKVVLWTFVDTLTTSAQLDSAYIGVHTVISGANNDNYSVAAYTYNSSLSLCSLRTSVSWGVQPDGQVRWFGTPFNNQTLEAGRAYILAFAMKNNNATGNIRIRYDNIGLGWGGTKYLGTQTDLNWPLTLSAFSDHADKGYSVYIQYHSLTDTGTVFSPRRRINTLKN